MGKFTRTVVLGLLGWLAASGLVLAASLLPNGEQTFVDQNGQPYASGSVYFYIPNTLTTKTTWADAAQTIPNTNPVVLDSAGRAVIYGAGSYRQILKDQFGNTIWDKLTQGLGSSGVLVNSTITGSTSITTCSGLFPVNNGTAGAITITLPSNPSNGDSCTFSDVGNNAGRYQISLALNGNVTNTGASGYYMNANGASVTLTWQSNTSSWVPG